MTLRRSNENLGYSASSAAALVDVSGSREAAPVRS